MVVKASMVLCTAHFLLHVLVPYTMSDMYFSQKKPQGDVREQFVVYSEVFGMQNAAYSAMCYAALRGGTTASTLLAVAGTHALFLAHQIRGLFLTTRFEDSGMEAGP